MFCMVWTGQSSMSKPTSCDIEASVIAKNIASLHSALMDQPDATRTSVDETIRKMLDEIARRTWERVEWLGGHYCPDFDQMWIDRKMPAWISCTCDIRKRSNQ